ncbi:hypothetical protein D3C72_2001070 [compost metagenome]
MESDHRKRKYGLWSSLDSKCTLCICCGSYLRTHYFYRNTRNCSPCCISYKTGNDAVCLDVCLRVQDHIVLFFHCIDSKLIQERANGFSFKAAA